MAVKCAKEASTGLGLGMLADKTTDPQAGGNVKLCQTKPPHRTS
jgi:hypothetical protein